MAYPDQFRKPSKGLLALGGILSAAVLSNGLIAPKASAITYNFSFSNQSGDIAGTVEGRIVLPDGDGTGIPATSITVTSVPTELGYSSPPLTFTTFSSSFTVAGGLITASLVSVPLPNSTGTLAIDYPGFGSYLTRSTSNQPSSGVQSANISYTPVPLESDALPVVGSVLFMAGGLWWKKKRAQAKVPEFVAKK
jgi:hypothetical protein